MEETARIVLVPRLPEGVALDVVLRTERGFLVQASGDELRQLAERGIPAVDLYSSGNEYAAAVAGLTREEALAALGSAQTGALAALPPAERDRFGVA